MTRAELIDELRRLDALLRANDICPDCEAPFGGGCSCSDDMSWTICETCNGSGEGPADGTVCSVCRGHGDIGQQPEPDPDTYWADHREGRST
jgi:hypothetical protein